MKKALTNLLLMLLLGVSGAWGAVETIGTQDASSGACTGSYNATNSSIYSIQSGDSIIFSFVNNNGYTKVGAYNESTNPNGVGNWNNWVLCANNGETALFKLRADNWENLSEGSTGIVNNYNWDTFMSDMDGATVNMKVFYVDNTIKMTSTITTADKEKEYSYSYTKSDVTATNVDLYFTVDKSQIIMNSVKKNESSTLYARTLTTWNSSDITKTAGTINAWNSTTFSIDATNGLYSTGSGNRSAVLTYSPAKNSIQTIDLVFSNLVNTGDAGNYSYINIGSAIQIQSNQQNQTGTIIINGDNYSIANCNIKDCNRGGDLWTIHAEINTATNTLTALTLVGTEMNKKSASFTLTEEKSLGSATYNTITIGTNRKKGNPSVALNSIMISEVEQNITTANYTIKYVCGEGEIKESKTASGEIGAGILLSLADTTDFKVENTKYIYVSNDTIGKTIAEDGSTVVTVTYRYADFFDYTIKTPTGVVIRSNFGFEDDEIDMYFPEYILNNDTLYYLKPNSTGEYWKHSFTLDHNNYEYTVNYVDSKIEKVVFCTEGEDIDGFSQASNTDRASNGKMGYNIDGKYYEVTTLPAGTYRIYARGVNGNNATRNCNFKIGDNDVYNFPIVRGTDVRGNSDIITINDNSKLYVSCEGSSASGLDWFYIVDTSEDIQLNEYGYATYVAKNALDFSQVSTLAYVCTNVTESTVTLDYAKVVPAGAAVIVTGEPNSIETIPATNATPSDYVNLLLASDGTVTGGDNIYALNSTGYFQKVSSTVTIPEGKAYLQVASSAKTLALDFANTTAIKTVNNSANTSAAYNLAGQRVNANAKGIVILNGKKMLNK